MRNWRFWSVKALVGATIFAAIVKSFLGLFWVNPHFFQALFDGHIHIKLGQVAIAVAAIFCFHKCIGV
jgi:hypothetical protein